MARKNGANGVVRQPTKVAGYKEVKAVDSAFWAPHDQESGHPPLLKCAYLGLRVLPAKGKFREQRVIDVQDEEGNFYTVPLKGDLERKFKAAGLEESQPMIIEWLGFEEPSEKLPMGINRYSLRVKQ